MPNTTTVSPKWMLALFMSRSCSDGSSQSGVVAGHYDLIARLETGYQLAHFLHVFNEMWRIGTKATPLMPHF